MKWSDYKIKKTTLEDKIYSKLLYYRGSLKKGYFKKSLAVVGSRNITRYGISVLERIIPALVEENVVIISGFMYGVDTTAHELTVDAGGRTVAVFGSGLNPFYPSENEKLYTKILQQGGVVISEYEPEAKPKPWMFLQRNKVVVKLSTLGVLVIEAAEKSGSLGTAKLALKEGLPLYAVPGPITSKVSEGTNMLIKEGKAKVVTDAADILGRPGKKKGHKKANGLEGEVLEALAREPMSVDELAAHIGVITSEIANQISIMELKGVVTDAGGRYYAKEV